MKTAKAVQAIRQRVKVSRNQRIDISVVPFHPGSEVEVIVVAAAPVQGEKQEAAIYGYAEKLTHEKAIPRYTRRDLERMIHQSRGVHE